MVPTRFNYNEPVAVMVEYRGIVYHGEAIPQLKTCDRESCFEVDVTLDHIHLGVLHFTKNSCFIEGARDAQMVNIIGKQILSYMNG